jgi:hypothetical protein
MLGALIPTRERALMPANMKGKRPRRLHLALLLVAAAVGTGCLAPTSATAAVCVPLIADQPPYCPSVPDLNTLLDSVEEPAANVGDSTDRATPDEEACWEAFAGPAYDTLDGTLTTASLNQIVGGCGNPGHGGTTVYYPKNYMHDGYFHSSNFNHKLSNWFRMVRPRGCNSNLCDFEVYSTNSRNNVIPGLTQHGYGDYTGLYFNRRAARDYCGWNYIGYFNVDHPKPLVFCYYQYG